MPRGLLILLGVLTLSGCCRERDATQNDLRRFGEHGKQEVVLVRLDIDRFVSSNIQVAQNLPLDARRFIDWRHREWWNLRDEMAVLMLYEWTSVEKLTLDVARYYGYNVQNFPHTKQDAMRFFLHADEEWRNLVMDVCIFIEFENREVVPLREDLHRFYEHTKWEIANLDIDVRGFLQWREREYNNLRDGTREWFADNIDDWNKLEYDVSLFRAHAAIEGDRLLVDFSNFWSYEHAAVPRLVDDVFRFTQWRQREFNQLRDEAQRFALEHTDWETRRLVHDLWQYQRTQAENIPRLMLDVDHFFSFYERETRPLEAEVKRWWRFNIAVGRLAVEDMKHFFEHKDEEGAALQQDMLRFFAYGGVEWHELVEHVKRFSTCAYDPAFGDNIVPSEGHVQPPVMDDPLVRDWDINN